jgi:hypothetical protein
MTHLTTGLDFRCFPLPAVGAAIKFPEQKYKCLAARFIDEIGKNVLITHTGQKRKKFTGMPRKQSPNGGFLRITLTSLNFCLVLGAINN